MAGMNSRFKLGLALSGGGARGLAHIGFLKVLERENIKADYISGTSMGSIIAAAYARGMEIKEIESFAIHYSSMRSMVRMVNLTPPSRGFVEVTKVREMLAHFIPETLTFDDLQIPLAVCATDLVRSMPVTLKNGGVLTAVMASCSVPGVFPAVRIPPYKLVDGGVLNNLPVDLVKDLGAEKIVAIDVQANPFDIVQTDELPQTSHLPIPNTFRDLLWSATMMVARITQTQLQQIPPDLCIRPNIARDITLFMGFQKAAEVIAMGEKAAEEYLTRIRQILEI